MGPHEPRDYQTVGDRLDPHTLRFAAEQLRLHYYLDPAALVDNMAVEAERLRRSLDPT